MSGNAQSTGPVVVGIDDSAAAVTAAVWVLDEALCRDARLGRVHVIRDASVDGGFAYGAAALRTARAAINDSGKPVQVEIAILYGDPATRLLSESQTAAMVCVGSAGIRPPTPMGLGATAAILAESAPCPMAIIRGDYPIRSLTGPIGVVIDGSADDAVLHQAMQEARLRNASVLAMGVRHLGTNGMDLDQPEDRLRTWIQHYPRCRRAVGRGPRGSHPVSRRHRSERSVGRGRRSSRKGSSWPCQLPDPRRADINLR
ncbi:MAG: universal stress protein [Mycobacterium sp.]|uniref:universal stress protein n=1 Tax=Mycobacterium sp. TaxID=1785 RepID=UPI003F99ECBE